MGPFGPSRGWWLVRVQAPKAFFGRRLVRPRRPRTDSGSRLGQPTRTPKTRGRSQRVVFGVLTVVPRRRRVAVCLRAGPGSPTTRVLSTKAIVTMRLASDRPPTDSLARRTPKPAPSHSRAAYHIPTTTSISNIATHHSRNLHAGCLSYHSHA